MSTKNVIEYEELIKEVNQRVKVGLLPARDKINVYAVNTNYRLTAYIRVSLEYKFPGWNASDEALLNWFWEFADLQDIWSLSKGSTREEESLRVFKENMHMLDEPVNEETPVPVPVKVKNVWSCRMCGGLEKPEGKKKPSICVSCRSVAAKQGVMSRTKTKKSA